MPELPQLSPEIQRDLEKARKLARNKKWDAGIIAVAAIAGGLLAVKRYRKAEEDINTAKTTVDTFMNTARRLKRAGKDPENLYHPLPQGKSTDLLEKVAQAIKPGYPVAVPEELPITRAIEWGPLGPFYLQRVEVLVPVTGKERVTRQEIVHNVVGENNSLRRRSLIDTFRLKHMQGVMAQSPEVGKLFSGK